MIDSTPNNSSTTSSCLFASFYPLRMQRVLPLPHQLNSVWHRFRLLEKEQNFAAIDDRARRSLTLMLAEKLINGYLLEIGSDANLKLSKFYDLAISVPNWARQFHDGRSIVLFFEQLQLRHAIAGTLVEAEEPLRPSVLMVEEENETEQFQFQNVDLWLAPAFSSIVNR